MRNPTVLRDVLETALFGTDAEAAAFEQAQAEALRVYGLHRGNDLYLLFEPARDVRGLERDLDWASAAELLFDVQMEADRDGGWRNIVYPDQAHWGERNWILARDFRAQEAANVFAKAKVYEAERIKPLQARLRETTRAVARGEIRQ